MSDLTRIGLIELAFGALLGWSVVPMLMGWKVYRRIGVKSPRRLLQAHIDFLMMGLILSVVGIVLPDLSWWIAGPLVAGTIMNAGGFLPLAFDERIIQKRLARVTIMISFVMTSGSLVAVAVVGLNR